MSPTRTERWDGSAEIVQRSLPFASVCAPVSLFSALMPPDSADLGSSGQKSRAARHAGGTAGSQTPARWSFGARQQHPGKGLRGQFNLGVKAAAIARGVIAVGAVTGRMGIHIGR